jgi:hypothetical protein
MMQDDDDASP